MAATAEPIGSPLPITKVEWEDCPLEPTPDAALDAEVRRVYGIALPSSRFFYGCPWVARLIFSRNFRKGQLVHTDFDLAELIFFVVSQDSSCRYCYTGTRSLLRILGFSEERIRHVEEASFDAQADPRERAALDFVRRVSRSNPPPGESDKQVLRDAGYDDAAIAELAYLAAYTVATNRITILPAVPLELATAGTDRWFIPLVRPLLRRLARRGERHAEPWFLPPARKEGPFAFVTNALDGLPGAGVLRGSLDAGWESPLVPKRAKALAFAVVARGLGSRRAEDEATALLKAEGLATATLEEVLSHLASPALDLLEAALVPLARESIRPRPADIQRRARKLCEQVGSEQFLEIVGVIGLANQVARLSLVLCES